MRNPQVVSFLVAVVVPFVGLIGGIACVEQSKALVMGFPLLYFWVFLWLPVTSGFLLLAWYLFDRKHCHEED